MVLSRKPQTVRQEIVLRLLAHNAVRHVQALACLRLRHLQSQKVRPCQSAGQDTGRWHKRHLVDNRPILPIDLQTGLTAAVILGHIDALAHSFCPQPSPNLEDLLSEVGRHQIYAKPGRHCPRIGRKYQKGKRNKGNRTAQGQRWRRRKHNPSDTQAHQT